MRHGVGMRFLEPTVGRVLCPAMPGRFPGDGAGRDMRFFLPGPPDICSEHFMRGLIFMRSRCILFHLFRMKRRLGKDGRGRIVSAVCSGFCIQIHFQRDCL